MFAPLLSRLVLMVTAAVILTAVIAGTTAACTIGVAGGTATADGRPLLWKVRDNGAVPDNEVYYNTALTLPFIAVVTADGGPDTPAWMGVNVRGFALVNANVSDLADTTSRANGEFMRAALGSCRSVGEFVTLLEATSGIRDTHGNFGVIDSTGAALMIEASRDEFWVYDTRDAEQGFLVRTNFACVDTAGTGIDGLPGEQRFVRSTDLVTGWVETGDLTVANLVGRHARDFSDWASRPFPVPCYECCEPDSLHGHIDTFFSISANGSVSAAVIQGVIGEPAWLTTMWVHLGQPVCTVASPYWPVGPAPAVANGPQTAPLCDLARDIQARVVFPVPYYPRLVDSFALHDGTGGGLWSTLLPAEAAAIDAVEDRLAWWRVTAPAMSTVHVFEDSLARAAHDLLALDVVTAAPATPAALEIAAYPNPFNPATTLAFELPREGHVRLDVYDLAGRRVALLLDGVRSAGPHRVTWQADGLASGIYLARMETGSAVAMRPLVLVR